jgi:hypothetical protein
MVVTELEAEKERIGARIDELADAESRITAQLEHARAHGDYDKHWAINADCARRAKARQRMQLERELAEINRRIREERGRHQDEERDRRCLSVAKRILPPAMFDELVAAVQS